MTVLRDLPEQLSLSLASKLAGLSNKAFKRLYVATKLVKYLPDTLWHDGTGRGYIWRWELEKALGHRISEEECQAADRKLDGRRRYQRLYRRGYRSHRTIERRAKQRQEAMN
jgi:hypothetical protein